MPAQVERDALTGYSRGPKKLFEKMELTDDFELCFCLAIDAIASHYIRIRDAQVSR
jgi:hypothetical protein